MTSADSFALASGYCWASRSEIVFSSADRLGDRGVRS